MLLSNRDRYIPRAIANDGRRVRFESFSSLSVNGARGIAICHSSQIQVCNCADSASLMHSILSACEPGGQVHRILRHRQDHIDA